MAQTIIRTVSQLKKIDQIDTVNPNSLMEISYYDQYQDKFSSRAYPYGVLSGDMNDMISASMTQQYNLSASSPLNPSYFPGVSKLTVNNAVEKLGQVFNNDISVDGAKSFSEIPFVMKTTSGYTDSVYQVPNVGKVQDMINDTGSFVTSESITPYPLNDDEMPKSPEIEDPDGKFIHIRYDSSSAFQTDSFVVQKTGWLTMWGWAASMGDVDPEKAWIALYGNVVVDKTTTPVTRADVPLQFRPWIVGENSKQLQYVGFSMPVKKGMTLYVKSGFNINIDAPSGYQNYRSKTYNTNQTGSFFGYILEND